MKKSIFATLLAGALALGCSSMRPHDNTTVQPNAVTGAAGTTSTGIDSTANPTPGTASGVPAGKAANPDEPPGIESDTNRDVPAQNLQGETQDSLDNKNRGDDNQQQPQQPQPQPQQPQGSSPSGY
jgi:hypothetical protein